MDKVTELWATIKQLLTSRTIWGVIVMLLGTVGLNVNGLNDLLVNLGDHLTAVLGAALAIIGYIDRRPKPAAAAANLPAR